MMRIEGVEKIRVIVEVEEIPQGREGFVIKVGLDIRGEEDTVKIPYDDGEGAGSGRSCQLWPQCLLHQTPSEVGIITGGEVDM